MVHYPQKNAKHFPHISLIRPISLISPKSYFPISPKNQSGIPTKSLSRRIPKFSPLKIHFSVFLASPPVPLFIFVELSIKMKHYVFK
jgi:hypothetical protein